MTDLSSLINQAARLEHLSYLGFFVAIFLSGHVLPLPEDVVLLLVGYIVAISGTLSLIPTIVLATLAIIAADTTLFLLSRFGSPVAAKLEQHLNVRILTSFFYQIQKRRFVIIFFCRFIPGLRIMGPLVSGMARVNAPIFILYTCLSAIIYVPGMILLGFFLHTQISSLIVAVDSLQHVLAFILIGLIGVGLAFLAKKILFQKK